jgi:hypothetical protein
MMLDVPDRASALIQWSEVALVLAPLRSYWLGTTNRDGSPHANPVWGVVLGDQMYFYSERTTIKSRNVARQSSVVIHSESAEEVVIVYGYLDDLGHPLSHLEILGALASKYDAAEDQQYLPSNDDSFDVMYQLRPRRAQLWSLPNYGMSQRRWQHE